MNNPEILTNGIRIHGHLFVRMLGADEIGDSVGEIAREISTDFAGRDPLLIVVLNGAFIFAADLIRALRFDTEIAFVRVASYQQMQSTGFVSEIMGLDRDIRGRSVIVIEDIVDTGHTIAYLYEKLADRGAASIDFAAMLMKPEAYQHQIPIRYVGFRIPNRFVVGYGLDYDGYGRALRDIYVLQNGIRP
jgi:hypoxanthine phosphoribosyltransferase